MLAEGEGVKPQIPASSVVMGNKFIFNLIDLDSREDAAGLWRG